MRPTLMDGESVAAYLDRLQAWKEQGNWYPASGGTETPFFTKTRLRLLYCYQPRSGRHCYINLDTDLAIPDGEIGMHLA